MSENNPIGVPMQMVTYSVSSADMRELINNAREEGRKEAKEELALKAKPTLDRKTAMAQLNVSESTIINWGRRGLLRKVKYGHACFYFQEDIDRILRYGTEAAPCYIK